MALNNPRSVGRRGSWRKLGKWYCRMVWVLALGSMGCAPDTVTVKTHPTFEPASIKTVAVIPFTSAPGSPGVYQSLAEPPSPDVGPSEILPSFSESASPVPPRSHVAKVSVPPGAAEAVTEMVYAHLRLRPGLRTVPPEEVSRTLNRLGLKRSTVSIQQLARELGKALSLDAVITGRVRVYRERAGQEFAAIPAAVGFDIQLIDAKDGTVAWMGDYFEEQKPLTEDVKGFFERGGRWVRVEELARSGVKRVMQRLPIGEKP